MADRCTFCETRVDIGCRHIRAQGEPPPAVADPSLKTRKKSAYTLRLNNFGIAKTEGGWRKARA